VGSGSLERERGAPVVDTFMDGMATSLGADMDVRENVKFRGGNLARWVHERYPNGCCLAIEFKKTYMDEWSGRVDDDAVRRISSAVGATLPALQAALDEVIGRESG
jgi:hypothetical protein